MLLGIQAELSIFISKLAMVLGIVQAFNLMLAIAHACNLMLGFDLTTCIFVAVLAYNILSFFFTSLIEKQVSGPSSWQIEKQVSGPSSWPEGVQFELQASSSWPEGGQYELQAGSSWPEGVQFVLHTLPVHAKLVGDGDGMIVHVNIEDLREFGTVPIEIQEAAIERREARAIRDYVRADALHKSIMNCGYRVITANNEEILAREYRIRLRGIDAPEMNMEYGPEAKDALTKLIQGKPLTIHVYDKDPYDRLVGDVYCNGIFVQEKLLRKGSAWHYKAFDKRSSFAQWQREARNAGRGLWANQNPVEPWEFKKKERNRNIGENRCTKSSTSANYL